MESDSNTENERHQMKWETAHNIKNITQVCNSINKMATISWLNFSSIFSFVVHVSSPFRPKFYSVLFFSFASFNFLIRPLVGIYYTIQIRRINNPFIELNAENSILCAVHLTTNGTNLYFFAFIKWDWIFFHRIALWNWNANMTFDIFSSKIS